MKITTIISTVPARFCNKMLTSVEALQQSEWWQKAKDPQNQAKIFSMAEEWLRTKAGDGAVSKRLQTAAAALRRLSEQGKLFTGRNALLLIAVILYTVSPLDVIPDPLFGIGMLDDLALLMLVLNTIMQGGEQTAPALPQEGGEIP